MRTYEYKSDLLMSKTITTVCRTAQVLKSEKNLEKIKGRWGGAKA